MARCWQLMIALAVVVAILLQVWVALDVPALPRSHAVGTLRGTDVAGRLVRLISFFTIQSNVLCGLVSFQLARDPQRDGPLWRIARLDALFGITVTGVVYSTVLAKYHVPLGWREDLANTLLHYVVPIAMVAGWLLFGPRPRVTPRVLAWALAWPIAWFAYTMIRGALWRWYPYPFVDVTTHGYARVVGNALLVTAVFAAVAALFLFGDRRLPSSGRERAHHE